MGQLRARMEADLKIAGYAASTQKVYLLYARLFVKHHRRSPAEMGEAEVREIFKVPKVGMVAGCHVVEGTIPRAAAVRLVRDCRVVYEGKISSLRRFKDDVSEVRAGFDCGIALDRYQDAKPGDTIEAFVKEQVAAVL